jgi:hypothetical protein
MKISNKILLFFFIGTITSAIYAQEGLCHWGGENGYRMKLCTPNYARCKHYATWQYGQQYPSYQIPGGCSDGKWARALHGTGGGEDDPHLRSVIGDNFIEVDGDFNGKDFGAVCAALNENCQIVIDWEGKYQSCSNSGSDRSRVAYCSNTNKSVPKSSELLGNKYDELLNQKWDQPIDNKDLFANSVNDAAILGLTIKGAYLTLSSDSSQNLNAIYTLNPFISTQNGIRDFVPYDDGLLIKNSGLHHVNFFQRVFTRAEGATVLVFLSLAPGNYVQRYQVIDIAPNASSDLMLSQILNIQSQQKVSVVLRVFSGSITLASGPDSSGFEIQSLSSKEPVKDIKNEGVEVKVQEL